MQKSVVSHRTIVQSGMTWLRWRGWPLDPQSVRRSQAVYTAPHAQTWYSILGAILISVISRSSKILWCPRRQFAYLIFKLTHVVLADMMIILLLEFPLRLWPRLDVCLETRSISRIFAQRIDPNRVLRHFRLIIFSRQRLNRSPTRAPHAS